MKLNVIAYAGAFAVFRLRNDPHGMQLLRESYSDKFPAMLAKLWHLGSFDLDETSKSTLTMPTITSEIFSHNMLTGVVEFSKELSLLLDTYYLTANNEKMMCFVRFRTNSRP